MNLHTMCYFPEATTEPVDRTIGLLDLRKGLFSIVQGYLLCFGAVLGALAVFFYVIWDVLESGASPKVVESASTILFATVLIFYVLLVGSLILVLRGKWMCLLAAPERCHAKWFMFMAMLLILTGPALNEGASLITESSPPAHSAKRNKITTKADLLRSYEDFKDEGMPKLDTRGYVRLVGRIAGMVSSIFLVLFLRALALSLDSQVLARFTELFLLLACVLAAGVVGLVYKPAYFFARPGLVLGLAGGWLLCGLWYFCLILGAIAAVSSTLARPR
jgi:hypothetical protein